MVIKTYKSVKGFSLIEVVIVIFISAVVMIALSGIFTTFFSSYTFQNANINVSSSAALFLNEMNDIALQADAIAASRTVSGTTYTSGSTTVVFELPAVNSSGDVISNTYDYAILYSTSTYLYRILDINGSSARISTTKKFTDVLQNLTLTYNNATPSSASNITVDLVTQAQARGETLTAHLKQQVYLRNK